MQYHVEYTIEGKIAGTLNTNEDDHLLSSIKWWLENYGIYVSIKISKG